MSRGYGAIQRKVLALIEAKPDHAWTTADLCRNVYPGWSVTKAQRVALGRALRRMKLPGTWKFSSSWGQSRDYWLHDPCSLASMTVICRSFDPSHLKPGGMIYEAVERAKRFRDGTPLERINMRIEDEQKHIRYLNDTAACTGTRVDKAVITEIMDRISQLQKERDWMKAHEARVAENA
jgi:hypothetical protein